MSGFTKLVPEIVHSSVWNESPEIRCVWIAMLAVKDENGYVRGDAKTLARIANVSLKHTEAALRKFQDPDDSSHTPDNEARKRSSSKNLLRGSFTSSPATLPARPAWIQPELS